MPLVDVDSTQVTVFSGAGISGEAPAELPRGFGLRNAILRFVHGQASVICPGSVTPEQLAEVESASWKLELVLGRLWGIIGKDALRCLLALNVELPNKAHMQAALHLLRGGTHVTLNFDIGIELAVRFLLSEIELPPAAEADFRGPLAAWRALTPPDPVQPVIARDLKEFTDWAASPRPALLKIHGSLDSSQSELLDVVVVDNEELAQLHPARCRALEQIGQAEVLLVTGYSGLDPDVYRPLLRRAPARTVWACYDLPAASTVPDDLAQHGYELRRGPTEGLAVNAFSELVTGPVPDWPERSVATSEFSDRFQHWTAWCSSRHDASRFALTWAWLLADLGDHATAIDVYDDLARAGHEDDQTKLRHAEALYTRAVGDDEDRCAGLLNELVRSRHTDPGIRLQSILRRADLHRKAAIRSTSPVRLVTSLARAILAAFRVIVLTRNGRRQPDMAADAYRLLQQTLMRTSERLLLLMPRHLSRPVLALLALATRFGSSGLQRNENGNRHIMFRQRQCHLAALRCLVRGEPAPRRLCDELADLHETYWNGDDRNGAGNCTVSLALIAAAAGDGGARQRLELARWEYEQATVDHVPIASGARLLETATGLLDRYGPRGTPAP